MEKGINELNDNDSKLLIFCLERPKTISEIARHLNIAVKNVSVRLAKLLKLKKIEIIEGKQNRKYVKTINVENLKRYMVEILKHLKGKKEMTHLEFYQIYPFWKMIDDVNGFDKKNALSYVEFSEPALVERVIRLSPEGEKFLKENDPPK